MQVMGQASFLRRIPGLEELFSQVALEKILGRTSDTLFDLLYLVMRFMIPIGF